MRLTCLKCGHQVKLIANAGPPRACCNCGRDMANPGVVDLGARPSERAAERSRCQAFRAAGVAKNVGGLALGLALLSVFFFPLGLIAVATGMYVLLLIREPLRRYSGYRAAAWAMGIGAVMFVLQGTVALVWLHAHRHAQRREKQATAEADLRALLRVQRLFFVAEDTYGTFAEVRYRAPFGCYTLYLGPQDRLAPTCPGAQEVALPTRFAPSVGKQSFNAVAVANLDDDPDLDIWQIDALGALRHAQDDLAE